ncbi:MAG: hypothetical protein HOA75_05445 [Deltaproteobacteria bacterium]|jgi:hypothetical protein|nr:hypothetical protein [Deltaproteobacteria bacterium]
MRSRHLPTIFLLLVIFAIASCSSKPKPRANAIGVRLGVAYPTASFASNDLSLAASDDAVNNSATLRQPFVIQFAESLEGHVYSQWVLDFAEVNLNDIPPALEINNDNETYRSLTNKNPNEFMIKRSQTFIDKFLIRYPRLEEEINSRSEPSLSADVDLGIISFGKLWGIFGTSSEANRWFSIGGGPLLQYTYGKYEINVCGPYTIKGDKHLGLGQYTRVGECTNKGELATKHLSEFGFGVLAHIKLYSYIGDNFEINIHEHDIYTVMGENTDYEFGNVSTSVTIVLQDYNLFSIYARF